jgi:polysaccharide export outer membrane protein
MSKQLVNYTDFVFGSGDLGRLAPMSKEAGPGAFISTGGFNLARPPVLTAFLVGALCVCVAAQGQPPAGYRLQPGDELRIRVFQVEQLNADLRVQPDGKIQVGLLGEVQAEGKSVAELRQELTEGYSREFRNPSISLSITRFGNLGIYVTGQVGQPGTVEMVGGLTAVRSIVASGGLLPNARAEGVLVLRDLGSERPTILRLNASEVLAGLKADTALQPGDVVFVPKAELKVYVAGEVTNPGLQTMHSSATALTAVMQAGGFTAGASRSAAYLLRDNKSGGAQVIDLALDKGLEGVASVRLEPYDIVFVPKSGIAKVNQAIDQYVRKMLPFSLDLGFTYILGVTEF